MNLNQHPTDDYSNFNPWPFLNRLLGVLLIVIGITWLWRYSGAIFFLAKVSCIVAGVFSNYTLRIKIHGHLLPECNQQKSRSWPITFLTAFFFTAGLVASRMIEPYSIGQTVHYAAGAFALAYGGRLIVGKVQRYHEN